MSSAQISSQDQEPKKRPVARPLRRKKPMPIKTSVAAKTSKGASREVGPQKNTDTTVSPLSATKKSEWVPHTSPTELLLPPELVTELQFHIQQALGKNLQLVGTKAFRAHLSESIDGIQEHNVLLMDHSRPRAVILDYESYQSMIKIVRQLAFLLPTSAPEPQAEELAVLEARREARKKRMRGE